MMLSPGFEHHAQLSAENAISQTNYSFHSERKSLERSMTSVFHLRAMQALETSIRTGSLKAAAEILSITPAAVGQRIKSLEDYLGIELIVRARSGIRPTRELETALSHLSAAFRELNTVSEILDFQRVQEIHIVADSDWAELWLAPRLSSFRAAHPNILFCINGVGDVPLRLGAADCEVWFGETKGRSTERALFRDYLLPIGSPENTKRILKLPNAQRLEGFPLLHLDCYKPDPKAIGWPEWIAAYGHRQTAPERGIRYRQVAHALEAVYSDAGIIICGLGLVEEKLAQGKLALPFPLAEGAWTEQRYRMSFSEAAIRRSQIMQFSEWLFSESKLAEAQVTKKISSQRRIR
jgi:LysR family transcriptional regulator, glycine cleavage system transcriptional activator